MPACRPPLGPNRGSQDGECRTERNSTFAMLREGFSMSVPSRLVVGRTNAGYCLRIEGRGTMRESPAAHEFVRQVLDNGDGALVVALEACDYLDSTFLGCLADLHRRYGKQEPPRFLVAASPEKRARLLAPNHLDKLLKITEVCPEMVGDECPLPM